MTAREVLAEIQQRADNDYWDNTTSARLAFDDRNALVAALTAVLDATRHVLEAAEEQGDVDFDGWAPEALAKQIEDDVATALGADQ